ncbi:ABC transporter substrate-binding protein [Leifsonia sp. Root227]|uniref:ABC transporter substrate-binding protein n=1 Tax=Leifsonia sp. Root227 TaxID=1736496 RepID=UPI0009E6A0CC|nr:extracellular solute-binding protein [Leifsonia sp. Root227]
MSHSSKTVRHLSALTALVLAGALGLAGCASDEQAAGSGSSGGVTFDKKLVDAAVAKAKSIVGDKKLSGSLSVMGDNSGSEGALLQAFYKPFTDATGVKVNYTGSGDNLNVVQSRVAAGNPPDLVTTAPGVMRQYSTTHKLLNLSSFMSDELNGSYTKSVLDTASIDGKVYGVYQGFNNIELWYNPESYTGPKGDSATWQQVQDWTEKEGAAGKTAWCNAQGGGTSNGYPGELFIEALFAKKYGAQATEDWGTGKLSWTSPQVKDAFQTFGAIATHDQYVNGGVKGSLSQDTGTGSNGLVAEPPTCQAVVWGSWTGGLIAGSAKGVEPGKNLDFMKIPASEPQYANTETYSAEVTYAFKDSPETRAFLQYLASDQAQALLASANHWPVSNKNVSPDTYTDPILQSISKTYFGADTQLAAGPALLSKTAVITGAAKGVVQYLQDPSSLDSVLQQIQDLEDGK